MSRILRTVPVPSSHPNCYVDWIVRKHVETYLAKDLSGVVLAYVGRRITRVILSSEGRIPFRHWSFALDERRQRVYLSNEPPLCMMYPLSDLSKAQPAAFEIPSDDMCSDEKDFLWIARGKKLTSITPDKAPKGQIDYFIVAHQIQCVRANPTLQHLYLCSGPYVSAWTMGTTLTTTKMHWQYKMPNPSDVAVDPFAGLLYVLQEQTHLERARIDVITAHDGAFIRNWELRSLVDHSPRTLIVDVENQVLMIAGGIHLAFYTCAGKWIGNVTHDDYYRKMDFSKAKRKLYGSAMMGLDMWDVDYESVVDVHA